MTSNRTKGTQEAEALDTALPEGGDYGFQNMQPTHGRTCGPTRRSTKGQWTADEDTLLCRAVQRFKGRNWKKIAECFKDRTDVQCLHRWQKVLNPELVKGPWSKEEDDIIVEMVKKYGAKKWSTIAQALPGRIGKQCRERWHNHLNPSINKDAWTQEEELTLIRAHQVYGNKWAELTKFLPGRTDNSIKNHWNSSVKKKLESYLASGLLAQFPPLPNLGNPNSCTSTSSRMQQCSRDNSNVQDGAETEEASECSQSSTAAGCSQSDCNMPVPVHTREELKRSEEGIRRKGQSSSSSAYGITNSVNPCDEKLFHDVGSSGNYDNTLFGLNELPKSSSLVQVHEESGLMETSRHRRAGVDDNQETRSLLLQSSLSFNSSSSMGNTIMQPQNQELLYMDGCSDSLICQSESQSCETTGVLISNSYQLRYSDLGTSSCQNIFTNPSLVSPNDDKLRFDGEYDDVRNMGRETQESELVPNSCDGFAYSCDPRISPCDNSMDNVSLPMEPDRPNDASNSNLVQNFGSVSLDADELVVTGDENTPVKTEQQDSEALFYEPPRFPSLELPFFSCDLIPSGGDLQQAYSPLGIRQLMMSSMNCSTPFNLWDSPSRDDSPDIFLKSAAKSFICTPSILKKRQRELLSPVQEQKNDKKLERDMSQGLYCASMGIRSDVSSMDAIFCESGTRIASTSSIEGARLSPTVPFKKRFGVSVQDKENFDHGGTASPDIKISHKAVNDVDPLDNRKQGLIDVEATAKFDGDGATPMVQHSSGVLIEQDVNALHFFSPDRDGYIANHTSSVGTRTPRDLFREMTLSRGGLSGWSESSSWALHISPKNGERKHGVDAVPVSSMQSNPLSHPLQSTSENAGNNSDNIEGFSLYGETPLMKRGMESPSAWKSPWFANTFLPGPRIDTDITIEDIGYLMSPGDGCYDALALMRQLGEQSAAALAEAQEVLAGDNPELYFNLPEENNHYNGEDPPGVDVLNERRVLDFSECESPGKGLERRISSSVSFSSSSSYLMKGCR